MSLSPAKQNFVDLASKEYGEGATLDKDMVINISETNNLGWPSWFLRAPYRVDRGLFKLPVAGEVITPKIKPLKIKAPVVKRVEEVEESVVAYHNPTESLVPKKDPLYVPFGHYNDIVMGSI